MVDTIIHIKKTNSTPIDNLNYYSLITVLHHTYQLTAVLIFSPW